MLPGVFQVFNTTNQTVVINQTFVSSANSGTPLPIFVLMGAASLLMLVISFYLPLRVEGSLNVAKIGCALAGIVVNAITAIASFGILDNNGLGVAMIDNFTVVASSYTIFSSPIVTALFIVSGILCFILFTYSITQPQYLLTPDSNEYKNKGTGERK